MTAKRLLNASILILIFFNNSGLAYAQDTFGPTCDGVTVTCVPTLSPTAGPSPTSSNTPTPTDTPTPTFTPSPTVPVPTVTYLPRAGNTGPTYTVFIIASTLIAGGVISQFLLLKSS